MDLVIKQNINQQENGNSALLDLLYNLTKPDPITGQPSVDAVLVGRITVPAAYEDTVNFLNARFSVEQDNGSDFQVTVLNNSYYIRFADPAVEEVLRNSIGKGEGEGITIAEATAMNLGTIFRNNVDIELFDEFRYFISPGKTLSSQAFYNCSSLERLDLSNCTSYPNDAFMGLTNLEYTGGVDSPQGVIIIPEGTTSIGGWNNFSGCNKITSVVLPDSLTYIQGNNFTRMATLTEITVGTGMTTWVRGNFNYCPNFNRVNIKDLDAWLNITFESTGNAETPLAVARHLYLNGTEVTNVDFTGKTIIKDKVLWGCLGLTSVVLPNTIASIGNSTFRSCDNLVIADLNLPNLTSLNNESFAGTKIQVISNLGSVTTIPERCFQDCSQLTTINQGVLDKISVLGRDAFNSCTSWGSAKQSDGTISSVLRLPNLTSIAMDSVRFTKFTEIADLGSVTTVMGFSEMTNLTSVVLPQTCTTIGDSAFVNDKALTTINLNNITRIGISAFYECNNLIYFHGASSVAGELDLSNVTSIGNSAFKNCKSLTSLTIGNNITSISGEAFRGCTGLTSVTIPNTVTSIGSYAFSGSGLLSVTIPNSITVIPGHAFSQSQITMVTLPNTITRIDSMAFWKCYSLSTINFEEGLLTIGQHAIQYCKLGQVALPNSLISIEDLAFYGANITSVVIGTGIETIGGSCFTVNQACTSITVKATNPPTLGKNAFDSTNNCPIYVPSGSVSAYQSASGWSTYADRIQAIP